MSASVCAALASKVSSTPGTAFLGPGLVGSSFFFFANIGESLSGSLRTILESDGRDKTGLSVSKAVELWGFVHGNAARYYPLSATIAALSFLAAGLLSPPLAGGSSLKPLLFTASAAAFAPHPWSALLICSIDRRLLALRDRIQEKSSEGRSLSEAEEKEAVELFDKWKRLHLFRIIASFLSWGLAVIAIFLV
ncbi:uncharacterized protein EI90DRAFT_3070178 [Cantharellus anzutake]|uniref:uncharacterized protein n=1 Tax=Cantharellus anzutake TaxID=1750568 RepID=UPI00190772AE|nr:uncharacterized protein EI90DRAFT_3070178 [Cantharellus anzutake]KAF8326689.1 hypothetical protein EI90DRAFT_3070178 [Cantharellus anzutake]